MDSIQKHCDPWIQRSVLDEDNDEDEINGDFDEISVNREKADAEELSGSRRVSDTFLRFASKPGLLPCLVQGGGGVGESDSPPKN